MLPGVAKRERERERVESAWAVSKGRETVLHSIGFVDLYEQARVSGPTSGMALPGAPNFMCD